MRTVTINELIKMGWNFDTLLDDLIELDYEDIRGLSIKDEGTHLEWVGIVKKSPDSARILIDKKGIVGYWHFFALTDKIFNYAKSGKLVESHINKDEVYSLKKPGRYKMYFSVIVLVPELRDTGTIRLLDRSFYEAIEKYARKGVYFDEICLNTYTRDGFKRAKQFGMKKIARDVSKGDMYWLDFPTFLAKNCHNKTLLKLYKKF